MKSIEDLINEYNSLPRGYISRKVIHNKEYYYLQWKENGKVVSKLIKGNKQNEVRKKIARRKEIEELINEYTKKGKLLSSPSKSVKELTGYLMSGDRIAAKFEKGVLIMLDDEIVPLFIKRTKNIAEFLASRAIDKTRTNSRLLKRVLNIHTQEDYETVLYSYGATITDNYWFKAKESKLKYKDITFDGDYYSDLSLNGNLTLFMKKPKLTPQLTLGGSYEKCWRKEKNEWYLYKKGNENEIFSEIFCSKLAKKLNIPTAEYEYINGYIRTKNFAKSFNYEPISSIAGEDDSYENVFNSILELNEDLIDQYLLLIWFDALVNNVDRHNENLGILRNKSNGSIVSLAPNFDNNMALISRSEILNMNIKTDGFISLFLAFVKKNKKVQEYYKKMRLPVLTSKIINECFLETSIKKDEDKIREYLISRYKRISNL